MIIHLYSHFFKVIPKDQIETRVCKNACVNLIQWNMVSENGQRVRKPVKVYAASDDNRTEYRYHINFLQEFVTYAERFNLPVEYQSHPFSPTYSTKVQHHVKPGWKPREIQVPILEYLKKPVKSNYLVTLQTGGGKSYISMQHAADVGERVLYLIRPAFMDKWVEDIINTYNISLEEIVVVKGSAQLMALLDMARDYSSLPKFIIMSNRTYQMYLKEYEHYGEGLLDLGYACLPENMYEHLSVGIRYIDEVHLDYHLNFKADMYTNVPQAASFSASLVDSDPFMLRMYQLAYPQADRYKAPPPKRYIESKGYLYKLIEGRKPKYTWHGRKEYNHGAYEKWLLKKPNLTKNYLNMVKRIVDTEFIEPYKEGDRLLVFCYSIDMATVMTEYLRERYPQYTCERYVEDDKYENVMEPDIRVSTVLSAGTGIDIKKLKVAILTTAISSPKSNIQAIGRLRELKDDDRPPIFIWLTCEDIPKHVQYHKDKRELFKEYAKSVSDRYYYDRI